MRQIWEFLEGHLEIAESREMRAANEVTIGGFSREHAKGELRTRRDHEILEFLNPFGRRDIWLECFVQKRPFSGPLCKNS